MKPIRYYISLHGYASMSGPQALNWGLSCARAEVIRNEFIVNGVPAAWIITIAHGGTDQFSSTDPAQNQRVIISLQPIALWGLKAQPPGTQQVQPSGTQQVQPPGTQQVQPPGTQQELPPETKLEPTPIESEAPTPIERDEQVKEDDYPINVNKQYIAN